MSACDPKKGVYPAPDTLMHFRFVPPLIVCGHCLMPAKTCKQVIHTFQFGVVSARLSSRGRPPILPMRLNSSFESLRARALPPNRANSVMVRFFTEILYHEPTSGLSRPFFF